MIQGSKALLVILVPAMLFSYGCKKTQVNDKGYSTYIMDTIGAQKQPEGKLVDKDGNVYNTVTIGTQEWMTENLSVSHYRNGDTITEISDFNVWDTIRTGAWCYYYNDSSYRITYGKLYNWYAVNDPRGLAPEGWHIPSIPEWLKLTEYLGGEETAGGKLKDTTLWKYPNTGATNESGFSAIPAGYRGFGGFNLLGEIGCFWSSMLFRGGFPSIYNLGYGYPNICRTIGDKKCGISVRCIKDSPDIENKREDKNKYNYSNHNNFNKFWADFKKAVNEDDKNAVLKMTNFPFKDRFHDVFYSGCFISGEVPAEMKTLTSITPDEFLYNYNKIFSDCVRNTIQTAKFQTFGKWEYENYPVNKPGLYKCTDNAYLLHISYESECNSLGSNILIFEIIDGVFKLSYIPYQV